MARPVPDTTQDGKVSLLLQHHDTDNTHKSPSPAAHPAGKTGRLPVFQLRQSNHLRRKSQKPQTAGQLILQQRPRRESASSGTENRPPRIYRRPNRSRCLTSGKQLDKATKSNIKNELACFKKLTKKVDYETCDQAKFDEIKSAKINLESLAATLLSMQ